MTVDHNAEIVTVGQLVEKFPAFTGNTVRHWIHQSERYDFDRCVIRVGSSVYIDVGEFLRWLENHREAAPTSPALAERC
jgi:hypothetical protein